MSDAKKAESNSKKNGDAEGEKMRNATNSYGGYVRLGYIEDTSGLKAALGTDNVQVTFEISN